LVAPWSVIDGLVLFQKRIYIPPACSLFHTILEVVHAMGHEGVQKMSHRFRKDFHTPQSKRVVQDFIKSCSTCQRNKTDHLHPAGLLLPLPVPAQVWSDISIDFVEGLPKVGDKSVLTVVDRLSKYAHFILLAHPYTAEMVARVFFTEIVRLHGISTSIVSDRDPVFTLHIGRLCSVPLVPNCICPLRSTHNQMVRQKQSIKQLGCTFAV
jgi:hypothetical protein